MSQLYDCGVPFVKFAWIDVQFLIELSYFLVLLENALRGRLPVGSSQ